MFKSSDAQVEHSWELLSCAHDERCTSNVLRDIATPTPFDLEFTAPLFLQTHFRKILKKNVPLQGCPSVHITQLDD